MPVFLLIFSIFGGYWAFLEARFLEEVGDVKPTPMLYKPCLFEAKHSHSEMLKESQAKVSLMQGSL
jgi:hypothetical protein